MRKESVQKFDLEAAFKALNEVEVPVVKGIRPNREDLHEKFTRSTKLVTDILVEDYFDVSDSSELEQASEEREAEIAKAKLARIEKIVDLEAETEEDLLPSYVGKFIMQCPQCMTLFYKNEEDIERSEETPDVVNLNEPCQHCGNSSGYTLVGKVDTVGEDEASQYDVEDFDENELDLDFDEEPTEETEEETTEETEEVATEEDEELDLAPVEETEEEEVKESLREGWDADVANADKLLDEIVSQSGNDNYDDGDGYWSGDAEWCNRYMYYTNSVANYEKVEELCDKYSTATCKFYVIEDDTEEDPVSEIGYTLTKETTESLKEATIHISKAEMAKLDKEVEEATKEVAKYNIDTQTQQNSAGQTEKVPVFDAVPENQREAAKKAYDRYVKALAARPDRMKNVIKYTDESLTEGIDKELDDKLKAHNDYIEYLKKMIEDEEANLAKATNEYVKKAIQRRLDAFKADLEEALPEALKDEAISADELPTPEEADMEAAAENKEETKEKKESLTEDLDLIPAITRRFTRSQLDSLTPDEIKILQGHDREAIQAVIDKYNPKKKDESLTESTDLLADDGTLALLIYPERLAPEARKEKLLADPAFVKALELFVKEYKMDAQPGDLEDGVSAEDDMYDCAFEGIEGEDFEATLDELISYYLDVKAEDGLTEAAPQGEFVSKLKRNYSATEIMVKELKTIDPFSKLSTRTIQRVLLPYYIAIKGRDELSTQAMIDFFAEEGFAPIALDYFFTMDPKVCKELLKADAKFVEIFNEFAATYKLFPGKDDAKEPGEDDFDFAYKVAFDFDEEGKVQNTKVAKETIKAFGTWYVNGEFDSSFYTRLEEDAAVDALFNSEEFKTPVTDAEINEIRAAYEGLEEDVAPGIESEIAINDIVDTWESVEDFDDETFNKLTESYLMEVYSNVKSFEATGCDLKDGKLVVEGLIKFTSGKSKTTTFTYEAVKAEGKTLVLEGLNADFATEKVFTLACKVDTESRLVVESLNYKYTINNTLVEGLLK